MGIVDETKKVTEEILASYKQRMEEYQQRLKENEELVSEVQKTLNQFRATHLEMAATLRANAEALRNNLHRDEVERLNEFETLMSGIQDSIESIKKEVEDIQQSSLRLVNDFAASRADMSKELKEEFDQAFAERQKQNHERVKDFGLLNENIQNDINRLKDEVKNIIGNTQNLLQQYGEEHKEMSRNLKEELGENVKSRLQYVQALLVSFQQRLNEISRENVEMSEALRKELVQFRENLSDEDKKRIKEFEDSMKEIRGQISEMQNAIAGFLKDLSQNRVQTANEWQNLSEAIARLKNNIKSPELPSESKTPSEKNNEKISEEEKEEEENQNLSEGEKDVDLQKEENLEEKILAFINDHPEGVKVSDMEEPLGEQRMRIGYVCKKLLEEGKITKVDRTYFPLTQEG